jgi:hypothetical protein
MGTIAFQLPAGLTANAARQLERACVAGGPDNMPWPTEVRVEGGQLLVGRSVDESGYLLVPWDVAGAGRFMGGTATLMERPEPYSLPVELARGKVNHLRCQAADWHAGGLQIPEALDDKIQEVCRAFGRAVIQPLVDHAAQKAQDTLVQSYRISEELVRVYRDQVFQIRHGRQPKLDTDLGCRLGATIPHGKAAGDFTQAFNSAGLSFSWNDLEPEPGTYRWQPQDDLVAWAADQGLAMTAGPLVDFASLKLPAWLWLYERDLQSLAGFMCAFVESTVRRYKGRIRRWQLTSASNSASILSLGEDELLWLTVRMAETARQVDPGLELIVGVAQPWGEYMAQEDRTHSPFIFADTLIRSGLNLLAVDLEIVMGPTPRGSYCRDLMEFSRLLDLYALLGVPLRVTMGYPSSAARDDRADPEQTLHGGHWRDGFTPETQAHWAEAFVGLALCKPFIQAVQWVDYYDVELHLFPNCGLIDAAGNLKPVLQQLRALRAAHLR